MRRFLIGFFALAASSALSAPAGAAIISSADADPMTPDLVVGSTVLGITGSFDAAEDINYTEEFLAGPIAGGAEIDIGITNADGTPAGFDNLVLTISSSVGDFVFQLTGDVVAGAGMQLLDFALIALAPGENFTVSLTGSAVAPGTSIAFLSIQFSALTDPEVVPLPAAAPLLLSGVAGLAFVRRIRRKTA